MAHSQQGAGRCMMQLAPGRLSMPACWHAVTAAAAPAGSRACLPRVRSPARGRAAAAGGGGASRGTASTAAPRSRCPGVPCPCRCRRGLVGPRLRCLWCPPAPLPSGRAPTTPGSVPKPVKALPGGDGRTGTFGLARRALLPRAGGWPGAQRAVGMRGASRSAPSTPRPNAWCQSRSDGQLPGLIPRMALLSSKHSMLAWRGCGCA